MGKLIAFPSKTKTGRYLPPLVLCDSLPQLVEKAIANNLIVSCDSEALLRSADRTVTPAYAEDIENHSLYLVVVELPNGNRAHLEQPGYQLKDLLNGLLLGQFLSERGVVL